MRWREREETENTKLYIFLSARLHEIREFAVDSIGNSRNTSSLGGQSTRPLGSAKCYAGRFLK